MKKWYILGIVYIIIAVIACIFIYDTVKPQTLGQIHQDIYGLLDYGITIIEDNMNEITISSDEKEWSKLKNINLNDEKLKITYDLIVSDIRTCYLMSTDLENKTFNNIKILSFKDKANYIYDDIKNLNNNESCLKIFDKYNSLDISEDDELETRIKTQIRIIIDTYSSPSDLKEFKDLLSYELDTINKIASLSNWLKVEYDTYKEVN